MDIKKLSIAEIRNIAKRINSRLSEFEKQGLTDSAYYQRIITAIAVNRFKRTEKGHISLSKESLQLLQANQAQLLRIDTMPSLKHEVKLAKKYGAKTKAEIHENIRQRGKLEQWCENNLTYVYDNAKQGVDEAIELQNAFDEGKVRNMSYSEIWALIRRYEKAIKKRDRELSKSKFDKDTNENAKDEKFTKGKAKRKKK